MNTKLLKNAMIAAVLSAIFVGAAVSQQAPALFHQDVSWSPDGKYLAFCGMHDFDMKANSVKADIYVIRVDGSDMKMISSPDRNEFYTSWVKGRIAFGVDIPGTKDEDIYTANPDGTDLRQITKDAKRNSTPSFSPDGKRIAFVSTRDGDKYQIYTMRSDGTDIHRLTQDSTVGYFNPQWSPNGKQIVYYAEKGDRRDQVWVMNADGSDQKLLTANIGHNIFPGWAPDGKRIIFSSSNRDQKTDGSFVDGSFVYLINADTTGLVKLGNIQSYFARFSPDGKKLAYLSGKFPSTAIFIANADGSGAVKITK